MNFLKKSIKFIPCFVFIFILLLPSFALAEIVGTCPNVDWIPESNRGKSYVVANPTEATGLCCVPVGGPSAEWTEEKINACAAALYPATQEAFEKMEASRPVEWTSPIGAVSPTQLIGKAIKTVLGILGAVALLIFVYGGFVWMTSGGSPEKIKTARMTLVWAVLGMAVIFLSYAAVDFVLKAFGV